MAKKKEIKLIQIIAQRLYEGRQLCKFKKSEAAALIGITEDLLTKIESGINIWFIPLWIIHNASKTYDISTDYLFGFSSDWEQCEEVKFERQVASWASTLYQQQMSEITVDLASKQRKQDALTSSTKQLLLSLDEINEAFSNFKKMNTNFNDLHAGSQLQHRVSKAVKTGGDARRKLVRCKAIPLCFLPSEDEK